MPVGHLGKRVAGEVGLEALVFMEEDSDVNVVKKPGLKQALSLDGTLPSPLEHHEIASICIWGEYPIASVRF
jgi:hypothetical protein